MISRLERCEFPHLSTNHPANTQLAGNDQEDGLRFVTFIDYHRSLFALRPFQHRLYCLQLSPGERAKQSHFADAVCLSHMTSPLIATILPSYCRRITAWTV